MHYWVQRFKQDWISPGASPKGTQWLTVQVDDKTNFPLGQEPIFIHFGDISVEVRPGASVNLLSGIVRVLQNQR